MNLSPLGRMLRCAILLSACAIAQAAPQKPAQPKQQTAPKFNPAPPADLSYAIESVQKHIPLSGQGTMTWRHGAGKYQTSVEIRAALAGKILEQKSEGLIDASGLKPASFMEKRMRKPPLNIRFDRQAKQLSFGEGPGQPLRGNEQDRASVIWQLVSLARATPERIKPGMSWSFPLAGQDDVSVRTFKVVRTEKISTGLGELETVRIMRVPISGKTQELTLWLAPSQEWYPAKLRIAESGKEYVEQTLQGIARK